jgi:hypothetical protein
MNVAGGGGRQEAIAKRRIADSALMEGRAVLSVPVHECNHDAVVGH